MVHGWASPTGTPAPPEGFGEVWERFLPEMMASYREESQTESYGAA